MGRFEKRVALVTGGASGIGRATARRLRDEGARVAVVDIADAGDAGHELALTADVGDPAAWREVVDAVEQRLGGLDLVHLNAGVTCNIADVTAVSDDAYRRLMRVNVDGVFLGLRATVPALERRGGGRVVATASLAGLVGFPVDPVYTATKHAVVGLVRGAAPELARRGVVLEAVCPGIVDTPLLGDDRAVFTGAGFPLLAADDVADAVLAAMTGGGPGDCWFVQPGRASEPFRFGRVPGPRTPGAEGVTPPLPV